MDHSWASATVLIPAEPAATVEGGPLQPGGRIAALGPDGTCVGEVGWDGTGASLTLWADDPYTRPADGLAEGDAVSFVVYPAEGGALSPAPVMFTFRPSFSPAGGFGLDQVYVVSTTAAAAPERRLPTPDNILRPIHPNPVRRDAQISLSLAASAELQVYVLDVRGRQVATVHSGRLSAGDHALSFDVSGLAPGVYVCWARSGERVFQRRFTVVR